MVFCFDGDEAGRKAAFRAMEAALPCMEDGRQARFLFLPDGQDPDDAVRGGGKEHFEQLISEAMPLETFLFNSVADGLDISSLDGRARMSKLALPYIRQLPEGVFRQLMFQALAERTGLELGSLMQLEAPPPPREEEDYRITAPCQTTTTIPRSTTRHQRTRAHRDRSPVASVRPGAHWPTAIPTWPRQPLPCCCTSRILPA